MRYYLQYKDDGDDELFGTRNENGTVTTRFSIATLGTTETTKKTKRQSLFLDE
jgi:hypothetical protein